MEIKEIFLKNRKRILSAIAALIMVAVSITFAEPQINTSINNELKADILTAHATDVSASNCTSSPNPQIKGRAVTWSANTPGFITTRATVYTWSGAVSGTGRTITSAPYTTNGTKTATLVFSGAPFTTPLTRTCTVAIIDRPFIGTGYSNPDVYVRELQNALVLFGYEVTVDGIFGAQTKNAVLDFQRDRDLVVDGLVGPATWSSIDSAKASGWVRPAAVETPPEETPTTTIPLNSTITCDVDKTTIGPNELITYTVNTGYSLGSSTLLWARTGNADYPSMTKTGDKTASFAIIPGNSGTADITVNSRILWSDQGSAIANADCPAVTVSHPEQLQPTETPTNNDFATQETGNTNDNQVNGSENGSESAAQSGTTTPTTNPALPPAPDMLRCKMFSQELVLSSKIPIRIDCSLDKLALVTAQVVKGDYTPPAPPTNTEATIFYNQLKSQKAFYLLWDGMNQYDQTVEEGDYTFVISAKLDTNANSDYSVQKFKVVMEPPVQTQEIIGTEETQEAPPQVMTQEINGTQEQVMAPVLSKCPGINYPVDIAGHWAESLIKDAYDKCVVQSVDGNNFRPDSNLTRAEAVKIAMLAAGETPNTGCYDADCGSPFTDLEIWQGPWIRAAWDNHLVTGTSADKFSPNAAITRAESTALIAKVNGIPPHQGCYTANCGAGQPANIFNDIYHFWQGPWLRALWDLKIISGPAPHQFMPEKPVTRAEFVKLVMLAKSSIL